MLVCSLEAKGDQYYKGSVEFLPEVDTSKTVYFFKIQQEWKAPPPSAEDLEKERKKRERRERDRIRERARKQARREAEKVHLYSYFKATGSESPLKAIATKGRCY